MQIDEMKERSRPEVVQTRICRRKVTRRCSVGLVFDAANVQVGQVGRAILAPLRMPHNSLFSSRQGSRIKVGLYEQAEHYRPT